MELKGHAYQKYMPGQFFTLNGKYYEMVATTTDNRILVRRASEHIGGRLSYRQVRNYTVHNLEVSSSMGTQKTVNDIDIHYLFADFSVETPGYWKLRAHNDFDNGDLVHINGVPTRQYHHKQILKFDFSKLGDVFTDSVRMTLTNLLNEVFVTLFADNQPFISAVTPGSYDAPLTYSLTFDEGISASDKCIYIIEDSQLDIGLLVAVERNIKRIFQIISDYLAWNDEQIEESLNPKAPAEPPAPFDVYSDDGTPKKQGFFSKIGSWFKRVFGKKKDNAQDSEENAGTNSEKKPAVMKKISGWFKRTFGKKQDNAKDGEQSSEETSEGEQTDKQRKKAERAAAKAAAKAEKEASKEQKKAQKQEEKLKKQQEKESTAAENPVADTPAVEPEISGESEVSEDAQEDSV